MNMSKWPCHIFRVVLQASQREERRFVRGSMNMSARYARCPPIILKKENKICQKREPPKKTARLMVQ